MCSENKSEQKYLDTFPMRKTNAEATIEQLRKFFAVFGLADTLVSDNGPPFNSSLFNDFLIANDIKFITSPPYHPESNGLAERAVQTVKASLKKFFIDQSKQTISVEAKLQKFLFRYRNTPSTSTGVSPNNFVFNFTPRTHFNLMNPRVEHLRAEILKPKKIEEKEKGKDLTHKEERLEKTVKNTIKDSKYKFKVRDKVLYQINGANFVKWQPGEVVKVLSPHVYLVQIDQAGRMIRKFHVNQLKTYNQKRVVFAPSVKFNGERSNIKTEPCSSKDFQGKQENSRNKVVDCERKQDPYDFSDAYFEEPKSERQEKKSYNLRSKVRKQK